MPVAPYNPRNTDDPLEIEYRVEDQIKQHSDTVRLWQKQFDKTYNQRSRVETAIGVYKDLGPRTPRVRGRVRVKAHVFLALCLRVAVALANHHRGHDVASPNIMLCVPFCTTAQTLSPMWILVIKKSLVLINCGRYRTMYSYRSI